MRTSGEIEVTDSGRASGLLRALVVIAGFVAIVTTFNIFTAIHDAAEHGQRLATWEPATWEYTSGVATLLCCPIVYYAMWLAPPGPKAAPKFVLIHALASLAFSSVHILLMNVMRVGIYAAAGHHYAFGEAGFWYEYRKDLIAYAIWAIIFWIFTHEGGARPVSSPNVRMVDIQEGRRLLRVPIGEIAAIHAAGNYVEYLLSDGRRPLVRQPLSLAHRGLGNDFIRTHRSWAINIGQVRGLRAVGAGDYHVELTGGVTAPLSRRFPEALARIRKSA